jgi:hypothetical protein
LIAISRMLSRSKMPQNLRKSSTRSLLNEH